MPDTGGDNEPDPRRAPRPDPIEANLKRAFSETLAEPIPDTLARLLEKLRQGEGAP